MALEFLDDCSEELKEALNKKKQELKFDLSVVGGKLTFFHDNQEFFCDFLASKYLTEVKQNYSRSESVYSFLKPILKAAKADRKKLRVLDLTAGLGRDLFKFVLAGHQVTAFERDPVLYLLLKDGLKRFLESEESKRIKKDFKLEGEFICELNFGDSVKALSFEKNKYDLIYFDPMFEDKRKKAAPKKNMQMIKKLVQESDYSKEKVILEGLGHSDCLVLKASDFKSEKIKPQRVISFKGFNYYLFKN